MKTNHSHTACLLPQLANAAALHMVFILFAYPGEQIADHLGMLIWWGCMIAAHFSLSAFLRKPRELRSIVLLTAVFAVGQLGLTHWLTPGYPSFISWSIAVFMWIALYYRLVMDLQEGVKPESLTLSFEACAATLLIAAAISAGGSLSQELLIHLAIGLALALIALATLRSGHTRMDRQSLDRKKGGLLLTLLIAALGGCAALFCALTTGAAAVLLRKVTAWMLRVLKSIGAAINRFFTWLFLLFGSEPEQLSGDAAAAPALPLLTPEETATENGIMIYIIIAAIILAAIFLLVKVWRTTKLRRVPISMGSKRAVTRTSVSLWEVLQRALEKLTRRIRYELQYLRGRNTPAGMLIWLERTMKRKKQPRLPGETPATFLRRMADTYPACSRELTELSDYLDSYYFGRSAPLSTETAAHMRKKIAQGLRQTTPEEN